MKKNILFFCFIVLSSSSLFSNLPVNIKDIEFRYLSANSFNAEVDCEKNVDLREMSHCFKSYGDFILKDLQLTACVTPNVPNSLGLLVTSEKFLKIDVMQNQSKDDTLFVEDFSSNKNNWELGKIEGGEAILKNNRLTLKSKKKDGSAANCIALPEINEESIEVTIDLMESNIDEGNGFTFWLITDSKKNTGIMFHYYGLGNSLLFQETNEGKSIDLNKMNDHIVSFIDPKYPQKKLIFTFNKGEVAIYGYKLNNNKLEDTLSVIEKVKTTIMDFSPKSICLLANGKVEININKITIRKVKF